MGFADALAFAQAHLDIGIWLLMLLAAYKVGVGNAVHWAQTSTELDQALHFGYEMVDMYQQKWGKPDDKVALALKFVKSFYEKLRKAPPANLEQLALSAFTARHDGEKAATAQGPSKPQS